jgi:AraC family transcriptional regulator of adaptative response/methylated-DNA-[protein]-cysteine methyltransferase
VAESVGSAVGANPVAYLIPRHRVIRETGVIGEHRWGAARKIAMLVRENGRSDKRNASVAGDSSLFVSPRQVVR